MFLGNGMALLVWLSPQDCTHYPALSAALHKQIPFDLEMSLASRPHCPADERAADTHQVYPSQPAPLLSVAEITVSSPVPLFWSILERNKISFVFLLHLELPSHLVLAEAGLFPGGTLFHVC